MKLKDYTGDKLKENVKADILIYPFDKQSIAFGTPKPNTEEEKINSYIPTKRLKQVIKLMQILKRPLLIRGEPGSGKTKLAQAFAFECYGESYKKYYFEWHVKSSSKAKEGLYSFDQLKRLRDAQKKNIGQSENLIDYIEFGPLGKAFAVSTEENPAIVLIDEVDKADIDFPNDLLLELDEQRFNISELPETQEYDRYREIKAAHPPIIFITSNRERELPPAFLRRCVFSYINFPDEIVLKRIIESRYPNFFAQESSGWGEQDPKQIGVITKMVKAFYKLRERIQEDPSVNKNISTSEFLDWLNVMHFKFINGEILPGIGEGRGEDLPFYEVLLKSYEDLAREEKGLDKEDKLISGEEINVKQI